MIKEIMDSHVSEAEMVNAIDNLKKNKSCGLDGLPAEVLRSQKSVLTYPLCLLFNYMLEKEEFPQDWINGLTIPIPKGGNPNNPEN